MSGFLLTFVQRWSPSLIHQYEQDKGEHVGSLLAVMLTGFVIKNNCGPLDHYPGISTNEPAEVEQCNEKGNKSIQPARLSIL